MSAAFDDYILKIAALDATEVEAEAVIQRLRAFAAPLIEPYYGWQDCYVEILGRRVPTELEGRKKINGNDVPSPTEIRAALVAHDHARHEAIAAWEALSEAERKELLRPSWASDFDCRGNGREANLHPQPWRSEEILEGYVIRDANDRALAYVYNRPTETDDIQILTNDEARRVAVKIAGLPGLLEKIDDLQRR
jgi:hypothetical protein